MGGKIIQMDLFGGETAPCAARGGEDAAATPDRVPPALSVAPEPDMVRVAPGRHAWVPKSAATPPDEYVVCRWSRQQDGTWAVTGVNRYFPEIVGSEFAGKLLYVGDDGAVSVLTLGDGLVIENGVLSLSTR